MIFEFEWKPYGSGKYDGKIIWDSEKGTLSGNRLSVKNLSNLIDFAKKTQNYRLSFPFNYITYPTTNPLHQPNQMAFIVSNRMPLPECLKPYMPQIDYGEQPDDAALEEPDGFIDF